MTGEEVFEEILTRLSASPDGAAVIDEVELSVWPAAAVAALKSQGLLRKAKNAVSVVCPGCEQSCTMPVVAVHAEGYSDAPFVVCDKRSDINRVAVSPERLRLWKCDSEALAKFLAASLGMRASAAPSSVPGLRNVGVISGAVRSQMLALRLSECPAIVVDCAEIALSECIAFSSGTFSIDPGPIRELADRSTSADPRYTPSQARREARKLDTEAMYRGWRRMFGDLKKRHPRKSDIWCSLRIAASEVGRGRSAETIRKHMTAR